MGGREHFRAAVRQSLRHPVRSLLTVLGTVIGIAVMTAVLSVGEAGQDRIKLELEKFGINKILIFPDPYSRIDRESIERIRASVGGASGVTGMALWRGSAEGERGNVTVEVTGTTRELAETDNKVISYGRFISGRDEEYSRHIAVLNESCAEALFRGEAIGKTVFIRGLGFEIVGIEADTEQFYNAAVSYKIYIPISAYEYVFGGGLDQISFVAEENIGETVDEATRIIYETYDGTLSVLDMSEQMKYADEILHIIRLVLGAVAVMSLVVGGIGIMNIMLVTVSERRREIGLKKALGARNADILIQFLAEAALYAAVGTALGAAAGVLITVAAERAIGLSAAVSPASLATAVGLSAFIGLGAGLLPAVRAARLDPAEALRD